MDAFIPQGDGLFAAVIDAKIGGVYLQTGYFSRGCVSELSGPQMHPINRAAEILKNVPILVTPNAIQLRPKLEREVVAPQWKWQESYPSPMDMAWRAKQKIERQEFSLDGHLDLLYLRKTQAEIEKEKMRS